MLLEVWGNLAGGQRRSGQHQAQRQGLSHPAELGRGAGLLHGVVTPPTVAQMPACERERLPVLPGLVDV